MAAWLLAGHACAGLTLSLTPLPLPLTVLLTVALLLSLVWYWPRHVSRTAAACLQIVTWEAERQCRLQRRDGAVAQAALCGQAFVQPWLVILRLAGPGRTRRYQVILPDMLDATTFRRLRVRLRLELERRDAH
ncbi:MAG: protein YgfX [Pseudomonadota bacterium]